MKISVQVFSGYKFGVSTTAAAVYSFVCVIRDETGQRKGTSNTISHRDGIWTKKYSDTADKVGTFTLAFEFGKVVVYLMITQQE